MDGASVVVAKWLSAAPSQNVEAHKFKSGPDHRGGELTLPVSLARLLGLHL